MEPYHLRLRVVQNSFQRLGGRWWITRKPKELKVFISRIVLPNQDRVWEYSCYLTQLIIRISTFHTSITQSCFEIRLTGCKKQQGHNPPIHLLLLPPQPLSFTQNPRGHYFHPKLVAPCTRHLLTLCTVCIDTTMHLHSHKCLLPAQLSWETGSFSISDKRGH